MQISHEVIMVCVCPVLRIYAVMTNVNGLSLYTEDIHRDLVLNHCTEVFSFESQLRSSISGIEILTLCLTFF